MDKQEHFRKLFIGGLSYETTDDGLKGHFEKWGEIVDCVVMRDPNTKKSRGFGFITYKDATMVDDAQNARPHVIDGREVEPKRAVPREESGKPEAHMSIKKIFVGGIKDEMQEEDIKAYFQDFGNIESVDVIMDKETRKKRGFGFITFDDYDAVDKLVLLKHHNIAGYRVEVKKAVSKQEMQGAMESRGGRGGRGGGRGGRGRGGGGGNYGNNQGGGGNSWGNNQGGGGGSWGGNQGGGSSWGGNQGGGGSWGGNQGGGNSWGGQQSGGSWGGNQGGGSWGGQQSGGYDYSQQGGAGGYGNSGGSGGNGNFGSNYNSGSYTGAQRGGSYNQRSSGPYGGGYGSSGGTGGGGGNSNYGGGQQSYNRR